MASLIDIFEKEVKVVFKGELYSVRDNGAVMRHSKGEKCRKNDNIWTFGTIDKNTKYLKISGERVHRIVAFAFLGNPPDDSYVVDHIDTNRQNNRPENLRWVTKFENTFLNETTRKKIELLCGCSAEEIMKDITILQRINLPSNFDWMRTVSKQEAEESAKRWKIWVQNAKRREDFDFNIIRYLNESNTKDNNNCYPLEPKHLNATVRDYYSSINIGDVLFEKEYIDGKKKFIVVDKYYDEKKDMLYIGTTIHDGVKQFYYSEVVRKKDAFVYNTRSLFDPSSLEKYMTIARGLEWTGGDVIDDYC